MSKAKAKQLFARVRPAQAVNMTEEQATERLREIHEELSDRGGLLKWHERTRLESEALTVKRALEAAKKRSAENRAHAVTVESSPCGGRITRKSEIVTKRDSKGRPMVIHEFRDHRPLSPEQIARAVEKELTKRIGKEIEGLKERVAGNQERIDSLGLTPTVLAMNEGAHAFAPINPA
jgi:hypothetical protein